MCPPVGVNFAALFRMFANTWIDAGGIGLERHRLVAQRQRELLPLLGQQGAADLHRLQQQRGELDGLLAELDLSLADARHVQQIVEQPLHVLDLPRDDGLERRSQLFLVRVRRVR